MKVARRTYPDRDTLMRGLAALVADQLRAALATKARATLAVPGGTTPEPFLRALGESDLDWPNVDVLLTDERMVLEVSSRSNTQLVRHALLNGPAAAANLVHYHASGTGIDFVHDAICARVAAVLPIDVAVLGMGADGHTASLFPGAPGLAEALAENAPELVQVEPASQPEGRLTLSARVLRSAGVLHLLITGARKAAALEAALADGPVADAPVRAVLSAPAPVTVHYAD